MQCRLEANFGGESDGGTVSACGRVRAGSAMDGAGWDPAEIGAEAGRGGHRAGFDGTGFDRTGLGGIGVDVVGFDAMGLDATSFEKARQGCDLNAPGFTLLELLVVVGIIALLIATVFGLVAQVRQQGQSVKCLANLRSIGQAFQAYATDNNSRFPDPQANGIPWEASLGRYMEGADLFKCPADTEIYPTVGSSYDWRDTGNPATTLAGKLMTDLNRENAVLAFETLPSWHGTKKMNAVFMDGSGRTLHEQDCLKDLAQKLRDIPVLPIP